MKDPDYIMKIMTTYGTLEQTDKRTQTKFKRGDVMETKGFMCTEVVENMFLYRHQVANNNNRRHVPISIERTWDTKYLPGFFFYWYLAVSEVNENYNQAYFLDSSDAIPHILSINNPNEIYVSMISYR